ncbi:hypothetical protein [Sphaerotilus sp.]|uniref:hypothetical protein n=1 Tax=Sphaerotilus sp. TaxID=2093942 RepID=UPI00286EAAE4|nr:hypothetical protein [Sphaerotilus sp.]
MVPVRSIGANVWLITCTAERVETRARHGRARWSLCAGLRRRLTATRLVHTLA